MLLNIILVGSKFYYIDLKIVETNFNYVFFSFFYSFFINGFSTTLSYILDKGTESFPQTQIFFPKSLKPDVIQL